MLTAVILYTGFPQGWFCLLLCLLDKYCVEITAEARSVITPNHWPPNITNSSAIMFSKLVSQEIELHCVSLFTDREIILYQISCVLSKSVMRLEYFRVLTKVKVKRDAFTPISFSSVGNLSVNTVNKFLKVYYVLNQAGLLVPHQGLLCSTLLPLQRRELKQLFNFNRTEGLYCFQSHASFSPELIESEGFSFLLTNLI